jgi:hypothetical protein
MYSTINILSDFFANKNKNLISRRIDFILEKMINS